MAHITILAACFIGLFQKSLAVHSVVPIRKHKKYHVGNRDLAMVDVPFNYGNTISNVVQRDGIKWGPHHPKLNAASKVGCLMFYTPPKYWPEDLAKEYFGNKTVFGMLRDPYERLTSIFRSNPGHAYDQYFDYCDLNGAVRQMIHEYHNGNKFSHECRLIPQAEFFEPPYGITEPIDTRMFPLSANDLLEGHGYNKSHIYTQDIINVSSGCNSVWSADLNLKTKSLVREVYAKDFELLCKHFGYCNDENTCLKHVPQMCPNRLFNWDPVIAEFKPKKN